MSKTRIAKKAVHMIVALNVAAVVDSAVTSKFDLDEDSITVEVGSFVAGHLVANGTDRITEPMIDKIVTSWQSRRAAKAEPTAE